LNAFNYVNDTPTAKFTLKGFKGKREVQATVDSGASKSLIPVPMAIDLGLKLKEVVDVIGVFESPSRLTFTGLKSTSWENQLQIPYLASTCPLEKKQKSTKHVY